MSLSELLSPIRTFVFDVDGVLTDGSLLVTEEGQLLRSMNIKDGYAMQLAIKKGYNIWVISGGTSEGVKIRLNKLGISEVYLAVKDKNEILNLLLSKYNISHSQLIYMGDDIPDYGVMLKAGVPCCPADAVDEIKQICKYISPAKGGCGAARDIIEKVLKLNGDWDLPT